MPQNTPLELGGDLSKSGFRYHLHTGSSERVNGILIIFPESKVVAVLLDNLSDKKMNTKICQIEVLFRG